MPNFVDVTYQQTGKSLDTDTLGMRDAKKEHLKKEALNTYY